MGRTTSKAKATDKVTAAQRKVAEAERLAVKAGKDRTPESYRAAVEAITALPAGALDDRARKFVQANVRHVYDAVDTAGAAAREAKAKADAARKTVTDADGALRTARSGERERTRAAEVTTYMVIDVHKLMTQGEFVAAVGRPQPYVSRLQLAGKAHVLTGLSAQDTFALAGNDRAKLTAALKAKDPAERKANVKALVDKRDAEAKAKRDAEAKAKAEAKAAAAAPPPSLAEEAATLADQLTKHLRVLVKGSDRIDPDTWNAFVVAFVAYQHKIDSERPTNVAPIGPKPAQPQAKAS